MRNWQSVIVLFLALPVLAEEPAGVSYRVPEQVFASGLHGPWKTGTVEEMWIDGERAETLTVDPKDKRHLMVQIWYPAKFDGDPEYAAYILNRELYPSAEKDPLVAWLDEVRHVRTRSVREAALAPGTGKFPVLIYNHGMIHPHFSGTFQTELLASHGFVVVAIGHTGHNRIERFPDGYVFEWDVKDPDEVRRNGLPPLEQLPAMARYFAESVMPVHVQDIRFVLDRLQSLNGTRRNRFYQRLDLERIGALGWSLGGALSIQASHDDPRIKAAINLDGTLVADVARTGTMRPVLQMRGVPTWFESKPDPSIERVALMAQDRDWQLYENSSADWYDLRIEGASHVSFSDRALFEPASVEPMHPRRAHDIINAYTLEFFDKYLRGRAETPLLSGKTTYPDTQLRSRPAE